jgi:hypothetical protein
VSALQFAETVNSFIEAETLERKHVPLNWENVSTEQVRLVVGHAEVMRLIRELAAGVISARIVKDSYCCYL